MIWAFNAGRPSFAKQLCTEALALAPQHRGALASMARLLIETNQRPQAQSILEEATRLYPWCARFYALQALALLRQGKSEESIKAYQQALTLAPWEAGWRYELMRLYRASGQRTLAKQTLQQAPEKNPRLLQLLQEMDHE